MNAPVSNQPAFRSGMVSIVGRPNTGKSTLLNRLVGEKVAIVSRVPQTTRNLVRGIYTDERCQIVFIDTPGIHAGRDRLDTYMNRAAAGAAEDADALIHLVDASEPTGPEEEEIARRLAGAKVPVILGLNKVDKSDRFIPEYIAMWERAAGTPVQELKRLTLLPLSGGRGANTAKLIDLLVERLPAGPPLYPPDIVCDIPQRMTVADIIREKLLHVLREEVPHAVAVVIERMEPRRGKTMGIGALILVERETQKAIVISKGGQLLKKIGTLARAELEDLLESKVYLDLHVKSRKDWREDHGLLAQMGYE